MANPLFAFVLCLQALRLQALRDAGGETLAVCMEKKSCAEEPGAQEHVGRRLRHW